MKDTKANSSKLARKQRLKAAARKKAIIAGCLLLVMGGMWVRLLVKRSGNSIPKKAKAVTVETITETAPVKQASKHSAIKHTKIEVVPGRNDVLVRDIFSQKTWNGKSNGLAVDAAGNDQNVSKDDIRKASENLKLLGTTMSQGGQPSEVFINDEVVPAGSDFPIRHNGRIFRFTVEEVSPEKVVLKCLDVEVTLKMYKKD